MLALSFGLVAALLWAVHDLLARKLSQGAALLPILAVVLASGTIGLLPVVLVLGGWDAMTGAAVSGDTHRTCIGTLYAALSTGELAASSNCAASSQPRMMPASAPKTASAPMARASNGRRTSVLLRTDIGPWLEDVNLA